MGSQEVLLVLSGQHHGVRIGGEVAGRGFTGGVRQLSGEVPKREILANQDVVREVVLSHGSGSRSQKQRRGFLLMAFRSSSAVCSASIRT